MGNKCFMGGDCVTSIERLVHRKSLQGKGRAFAPSSRALALAVSLWIGGTGVAMAGGHVYLNADNNVEYDQATQPPAGATVASSGKMLTITGGDWSGWNIFGGKSSGDCTGYTLMLNGIRTTSGGGAVYGGLSSNNTQYKATSNTIILNGCQFKGSVYGSVSASTPIGGDYHGDSTVSLTDSTITDDVYGGMSSNYYIITGNTLNLAGENKVEGYVESFQNINIKSVKWGTPVLTVGNSISNAGGNKQEFEKNLKPTISTADMTFADPWKVQAGESMNLIECANNAIDANYTSVYDREQEYTINSDTMEGFVAGVTVEASVKGDIAFSADKKALTYTATENKATKLAFGDVEWKDSGALLDHSTTLNNVSFNGADVDTTKINFTNIQSLEANKKMTLVSSFGDTVGNITGTEYTVGTTLKGKGQASLSGEDLIYTVETAVTSGSGESSGDTPVVQAQEQTHSTLMGMEAGIGALTAGNESIGEAMNGLASSANTGSDGVAVYAGMGGGTARHKTGSHVDSRNWNAILALGTKNETSKGAIEWGGFFEYGRGNFTTHSDAGRADGTASYTGGGLLAKWTTHQDIYVEGSFRAGRTHDTATDMLHDVLGNSYGYNVHANYVGGHIGVGKIFRLSEGKNIDVYGKFFYNRRGGVSFNAGGQYDLDAVTSKILRTGFKYNADLSKGWNWYAGLAYEYEFDGESTGRADGAPIRAASIKGGSALGEVGLHLSATEKNPWEADLNLHGSCGQHRGVGGNLSVAYRF